MSRFFKGKDGEQAEDEDRKKILPNLPSIDKYKLKGSLRCLRWIQKKIRKKGAAFPLFMILLNTVYLTLGGLIFMAVERQPKVVTNTSQELVELFDVLKNSEIGQKWLASSTEQLVKNLTSKDLEKFENLFANISNQRTLASKAEWNIYNSIFFCMTVTTTIGYGNLAPTTGWGRVICVIYALLGIPLTLALLAVVGKILGDYINDACAWLLKWYRKVHKSYDYERTVQEGEEVQGQVDAPLWMGLLILFVFTAIMAGLFCWLEGWDFGTSLYFQYITFLTIGFGDVVPAEEKLVFVDVFLIFLGLSILSITLNMIASNIHHQMQKASFIEKLKEVELSDSSFAGSAVGVGHEEKRGSNDESTVANQDNNGGKSYGSTETSP